MFGRILNRAIWRDGKMRLLAAAVCVAASSLAVDAGLLLAQVSSPNPPPANEAVCKCAGYGEVPGPTVTTPNQQTVLNCGTSQPVNVSVTTPAGGGSAQEGSTGGTPDCATSIVEYDPYSQSPVASKTCNTVVKKSDAYKTTFTASGCQWNSGLLGFGGSWSCAPFGQPQVANLGQLDTWQSCCFSG